MLFTIRWFGFDMKFSEKFNYKVEVYEKEDEIFENFPDMVVFNGNDDPMLLNIHNKDFFGCLDKKGVEIFKWLRDNDTDFIVFANKTSRDDDELYKTYDYRYDFYFMIEEDAVLFKLAWV